MIDKEGEYTIKGDLLLAVLEMAYEQPYHRVVELIVALSEVIDKGPAPRLARIK